MFRKAKIVVVEPESVSTTIARLEHLTERIESTAAALERLVKQMREEEAQS